MLHLAVKAFYPAPMPFPLLHVDTTYKFREMIEFRDKQFFLSEEIGTLNNTTVNGNIGNDGDVYTTMPFDCTNSLTVQGSVYTQGGATLSSGVIQNKSTLWCHYGP